MTLQQEGLFIAKLGKTIKGFVHCVVADNLGAHSLASFVENFLGQYVCRFCTAENVDIQTTEVRSGAFCLRSKEIHTSHLKAIEENSLDCHFGVKSVCCLKICHFQIDNFSVTESFPSAHDLFEGIIPDEIALCITVLISKKYFTLANLNEAITFPFKWTDKTNRPHLVPLTSATKRTIGGNAHENWSLLRFLPLLIGVPSNEPAWQVLCDLKDIVELAVAPLHTEDSISYLDFKISEHRAVFQEVFSHERIRPKHHFLEHYSQLIRQFGPLVAL